MFLENHTKVPLRWVRIKIEIRICRDNHIGFLSCSHRNKKVPTKKTTHRTLKSQQLRKLVVTA